jgi:iron complex outermembrane receptor protein
MVCASLHRAQFHRSLGSGGRLSRRHRIAPARRAPCLFAQRRLARERQDRLHPNATDEYSINYTRQEGDKNAQLPVTSLASSQRYWTWPYWNIDSLYFLSTTALGDKATFKTRAYLNSFDNLLSSWDGITQTTQTRGYAFNSYYADKAWGGSGELDVALTPAEKLSLALFYRRDRHIEWQQGFPSGATEPQQVTSEDTWSLALENHLSITPAVELTLGGSYDWRNLIKAQDYANGALINYPLRNDGALNGQAQLC